MKKEKEGLKILWSSVSPTLESGYGRVTREVVSRLMEHGYDVMCHGYQTMGAPHEVVYRGHTFKMLESGGKDYGAGVISKYKEKYDRDVLITLFDIWNFPDQMPFLGLPWICYVPIDAEPASWITYNKLQKDFKTITYSDFAKKELEKVEVGSTMIPHGVDTKVYKPLDKQECREKAGVPEDAFLIGTVGMNLFDRKDFPRMVKVFKRFLEATDADAYLYMHANPKGESGRKYNLAQLGRLYGVRDRMIFKKARLTDEGMAKMYNSLDVYLSTSRAEGCGMPILEAQACGTPAIVANNSAQPEWVEGHGWIVDCCDEIVVLTTPQHNKWKLVDIDKTVEALTNAYENEDKRLEYGKNAREAMLEYDWDKVVEEKWIPFLERVEEELKNPYDKKYFQTRKKPERSWNFKILTEHIKGNSVLEMGCGDGKLLKILEDAGVEKAKGLDISEYIVKQGKEKGLDVQVHNCGEELPFEADSFDTVFSMHLLEHLENDAGAIQESLRVAKKRAIHLIPLGFRDDWTHKRVYGYSSALKRLNPTRYAGFNDGDLLLIYDRK